MQITVNNVVISVSEGNITAWQGEMIVNASNSGLYGGGEWTGRFTGQAAPGLRKNAL